MKNRRAAKEIIPTMTITSKFLEMIALITVGKEASKFSQSMLGRCPRFWMNKLLNHKADMITIGTKLKNSATGWEKFIRLIKRKGKTRDNQVAKPQPKIVKKR